MQIVSDEPAPEAQQIVPQLLETVTKLSLSYNDATNHGLVPLGHHSLAQRFGVGNA